MSLARYHISPDNAPLCKIAERHPNGSVDLVNAETGEVCVIMAPVSDLPTLGHAVIVSQVEAEVEIKAKTKKPSKQTSLSAQE